MPLVDGVEMNAPKVIGLFKLVGTTLVDDVSDPKSSPLMVIQIGDANLYYANINEDYWQPCHYYNVESPVGGAEMRLCGVSHHPSIFHYITSEKLQEVINKWINEFK